MGTKRARKLPLKVAGRYEKILVDGNFAAGFLSLSATERKLFRSRSDDKKTLAEIASEYGISKQAVWQREIRVLKKISRHIAG